MQRFSICKDQTIVFLDLLSVARLINADRSVSCLVRRSNFSTTDINCKNLLIASSKFLLLNKIFLIIENFESDLIM